MATASSTDAVPEVDEERFLTCPICFEILTEPRTLSCFHSFCKRCLSTFVESHREKDVDQKTEDFNCPECNRKFTLSSEDGVEGMESYSYIRNKLYVFNIQRQAMAKTLKCSQSQCQGEAVCRCCACEISMCENCFEDHQTKPDFKTHTVLSLFELTLPENAAKLKPKLYCKIHEKKTVKFFCETCQELICKDCKDFIHLPPEHLCCPMAEAAAKRREKLKAHCQVLEKQLEENNESLKSLSYTQECLKNDTKAAIDGIIQQKEMLLKAFMEKINEKAERLKDKVEEDYKEALKTIEEEEQQLKDHINKLKGALYSPPDQDPS